MWIFSRQGFYSCTVSKQDASKIQIRARAAEDLAKLSTFLRQTLALPELNNLEVLEIPHADYRYRLIVPRKHFPAIVAAMAADIDYSNFKSEIVDRRRHDLYSRVWGVMLDLQRPSLPGPSAVRNYGLWDQLEEESNDDDELTLEATLEDDDIESLEELQDQEDDLFEDERYDPRSPFYDPWG